MGDLLLTTAGPQALKVLLTKGKKAGASVDSVCDPNSSFQLHQRANTHLHLLFFTFVLAQCKSPIKLYLNGRQGYDYIQS